MSVILMQRFDQCATIEGAKTMRRANMMVKRAMIGVNTNSRFSIIFDILNIEPFLFSKRRN
jgi:hypothetical protein